LTDFRKYSNIKFHENLSSGHRVVPCECMDGQTDMTMLIVGFHSYANAPKLNVYTYKQTHTILLLLRSPCP